jgi:hypothetical protein
VGFLGAWARGDLAGSLVEIDVCFFGRKPEGVSPRAPTLPDALYHNFFARLRNPASQVLNLAGVDKSYSNKRDHIFMPQIQFPLQHNYFLIRSAELFPKTIKHVFRRNLHQEFTENRPGGRIPSLFPFVSTIQAILEIFIILITSASSFAAISKFDNFQIPNSLIFRPDLQFCGKIFINGQPNNIGGFFG